MDCEQDLLQSGLGGPKIELVRLPRELSILVVEQVDVDAGLAVSVLSADPRVIVKVAPDRPSALHMLADSSVQLILLGVEEDESDAIDLLAELKELEHTSRIPVVVLALPVDGRSLDHWYDRGAAAVLRKPMRLTAHRELMRAVEGFWLGHALLPDSAGASAGRQRRLRDPATEPAHGDHGDHAARMTGERTLTDAAREFGLTRELLFALSFDGSVAEASGPWHATVGLRADEVRGRELIELVHHADRPAFDAALASLRAGGRVSDVTSRISNPGGTWRWLLWSAAAVSERSISYAAARDVTPRADAGTHLPAQPPGTDRDPMTGMFTRKRFEVELERELSRSARYGTAGAVLAIDLDNFRRVNDTFGHMAGDDLIARAASILRRRLRMTDTAGRLGDDEFGAILPGVEVGEAVLVAQSVLAMFRNATRAGSGDEAIQLTASVGVAPFHGGAELSADALIVEADIALCDAKQAGRDCVVVFHADGEREPLSSAQPSWPERVREAVDNKHFVLHAQPIIALGQDGAERHELLLRMVGEHGDLIPPSTFLGVAERAGMITEIDRWVVGEAVKLMAEHRRAGRSLNLEVNVAAHSLRDPEFSQYIADELGNAGIDGRGLCLEVTETAAIENFDRAKRFSEELTDLGCEFALDDFGSGFASFYNVKHLPFDYLKIDGDFIHELPDSPIDQVVVKSIVDIAGSLGKRTIAEFVGDAETLELLRSGGVDFAQGFHVGRPAPLANAGLGQAERIDATPSSSLRS
jgi:diguanylate cyclase (GGDEF)-like protein/PAS domain S-box-containing protein